jgi:hypothetical protein
MGQLFVDQVLEIAQQTQVEYLVGSLGREITERLDFILKWIVAFDKHVFTLGDDIQTDLLLKLQIKK